MKLRQIGVVKRLNVEHRTLNIERPILMALRFLYLRPTEPQPGRSVHLLAPLPLQRKLNLPTSTRLPSASSGPEHVEGSSSQAEFGIPNSAFGFTLVEILLATLILGIVVTTVLASFNAVLSTTEAMQTSTDLYEMAKNCLSRMTLDLESIYISQRPFYRTPETDSEPDPYRLVGATKDADGTPFAKLRFTSRAHVGFEEQPHKGIAEIVYYVTVADDGRRVLKRSDHLYPYPEFEERPDDPVLCKDVKSLAFKYIDAEDNASESWDSESEEFGYATPQAVTVQLEIGDEKTSTIFETAVKLPIYREKAD
jgi:general secretion pathway protein J